MNRRNFFKKLPITAAIVYIGSKIQTRRYYPPITDKTWLNLHSRPFPEFIRYTIQPPVLEPGNWPRIKRLSDRK